MTIITQKKFSDIEWVKLDSRTNGEQFNKVSKVLHDKNLLIASYHNKIDIWDIKNPVNIHLISTIKDLDYYSKIKKRGDLLFLFGIGVQIINISGIKNPFIEFNSKLSKIKNGCSVGDALYVNYGNDISLLTRNDEITKLFTIQNDDYFYSYPFDIDVFEDLIFVSGRHSGLSIYKIFDNNSVERLSTHKVGYTPTNISWEVSGQKMILVGNEDVIRYDVSNLHKPRRSKSCKLKNVELVGQYVKRNNEIIVAGLTITNEKPIIGIIELAENELRLVKKQKITDYNTKEIGRDSMKGIICKDDYLMLFTYHRGMGLFKAK